MRATSNIVEGERKDFIEQDCCLEVEGKSYYAGGAWLLLNKKTGLREGVLYLHREIKEKCGAKWIHWFVGTWDGSKRVRALCLNEWRSNFGDTRSHFFFVWDDVRFWGINAGDNDIVRCREYKNQRGG